MPKYRQTLISRRDVLAGDVLPPEPHKLPIMSEAGAGGGGEAGLPRLPPGRHGLPREFVVENQRQRIAAGMIAVVVAQGYPAASVTQIVAGAGVSRRTFYNYYSDKGEAFFDVYGQVTDFLCEVMIEAGRVERGWAARVRAELDALLDCFAANPDLGRFCLVCPPAAGGMVAATYRTFLERLLAILIDGRPKSARRPSPAAEYGLVGGMAALIVGALDEGGPEAITELGPEVTELVLTPYLGREAAARAAR
jgi:AcrR family transcriptional regulator